MRLRSTFIHVYVYLAVVLLLLYFKGLKREDGEHATQTQLKEQVNSSGPAVLAHIVVGREEPGCFWKKMVCRGRPCEYGTPSGRGGRLCMGSEGWFDTFDDAAKECRVDPACAGVSGDARCGYQGYRNGYARKLNTTSGVLYKMLSKCDATVDRTFLLTVRNAAHNKRIITTLTNCRALPLLHIWVHNLNVSQGHTKGILIGAQDDAVIKWCNRRGLAWADVRASVLCPWLREGSHASSVTTVMDSYRSKTGTLSAMHCKPKYLEGLLNANVAVLMLDSDVLAVKDPSHLLKKLPSGLAMQCGERGETDKHAFRVWPNTGIIHASPTPQALTFVRMWSEELLWWRDALQKEGDMDAPRPHINGRRALREWQLVKRLKDLGLGNRKLRTKTAQILIRDMDAGKLTVQGYMDVMRMICPDSSLQEMNGKKYYVCKNGRTDSSMKYFGPLTDVEWELRENLVLPKRLQAVSALREDGFQMGEITDQEIARELLHTENLANGTTPTPFTCVPPPTWSFPHLLPEMQAARIEYLKSAIFVHVTGKYTYNHKLLRIKQGQIMEKHIAMRMLGLIAPNCPKIEASECSLAYPDLDKALTVQLREHPQKAA